jgi:hypothetical protein
MANLSIVPSVQSSTPRIQQSRKFLPRIRTHENYGESFDLHDTRGLSIEIEWLRFSATISIARVNSG